MSSVPPKELRRHPYRDAMCARMMLEGACDDRSSCVSLVRIRGFVKVSVSATPCSFLEGQLSLSKLVYRVQVDTRRDIARMGMAAGHTEMLIQCQVGTGL